jgi:hypothetical protein
MLMGIVAAMFSFVISYSNLQSVSAVTVKTSSVIRTFEERSILLNNRGKVVTVSLSGYLFFGSAVKLLQEIKSKLVLSDDGLASGSNTDALLLQRLNENQADEQVPANTSSSSSSFIEKKSIKRNNSLHSEVTERTSLLSTSTNPTSKNNYTTSKASFMSLTNDIKVKSAFEEMTPIRERSVSISSKQSPNNLSDNNNNTAIVHEKPFLPSTPQSHHIKLMYSTTHHHSKQMKTVYEMSGTEIADYYEHWKQQQQQQQQTSLLSSSYDNQGMAETPFGHNYLAINLENKPPPQQQYSQSLLGRSPVNDISLLVKQSSSKSSSNGKKTKTTIISDDLESGISLVPTKSHTSPSPPPPPTITIITAPSSVNPLHSSSTEETISWMVGEDITMVDSSRTNTRTRTISQNSQLDSSMFTQQQQQQTPAENTKPLPPPPPASKTPDSLLQHVWAGQQQQRKERRLRSYSDLSSSNLSKEVVHNSPNSNVPIATNTNTPTGIPSISTIDTTKFRKRESSFHRLLNSAQNNNNNNTVLNITSSRNSSLDQVGSTDPLDIKRDNSFQLHTSKPITNPSSSSSSSSSEYHQQIFPRFPSQQLSPNHNSTSKQQQPPHQRTSFDSNEAQLLYQQQQPPTQSSPIHNSLQHSQESNNEIEMNTCRTHDETTTEYLVLDFTEVLGVDATAARTCFLTLVQFMRTAHVTVVFANANTRIEELLRAHRVMNEDSIVIPDLDDALEWCEDQILQR